MWGILAYRAPSGKPSIPSDQKPLWRSISSPVVIDIGMRSATVFAFAAPGHVLGTSRWLGSGKRCRPTPPWRCCFRSISSTSHCRQAGTIGEHPAADYAMPAVDASMAFVTEGRDPRSTRRAQSRAAWPSLCPDGPARRGRFCNSLAGFCAHAGGMRPSSTSPFRTGTGPTPRRRASHDNRDRATRVTRGGPGSSRYFSAQGFVPSTWRTSGNIRRCPRPGTEIAEASDLRTVAQLRFR